MAKKGYIQITQDSQSLTDNTSVITVKGFITTSEGSYRGDHRSGTYNIYQGGTLIKSGAFTSGAAVDTTTTLFSVTLTVNHDDDGKSGTITADYNYDSGWCLGTGSLILDTIYRASTIKSISGGEFGSPVTVTIERQSDSFTHRVIYQKPGGATQVVSESVETSITFTPSLDDCSLVPDSISGMVAIYVETYCDGTLIGSVSQWHVLNVPESIKPSVSILITDPTGYADDYGSYIQSHSKIQVQADMYLAYGSEIVSCKITVDGKEYVLESTDYIETEVLQDSGSLSITATVTDTRGRSGSTSKNVTVLAYNAPVISLLKVKRCDSDGTENDQGEYIKVTFSGQVTALNNKNIASYVLEYKKTADSSYTNVDLTNLANSYSVTDSETIFVADTGSSYDIRLTVTDAFGTTYKSTVASTAYTLVHYNKTGKGLSFGKVSEKDAFESNMDSYFYKDVYFRIDKEDKTIFDILGDYIVEQGTVGDWTYRKWNSGIAECWLRSYFTDASVLDATINGFYQLSKAIDLPLTMIDYRYAVVFNIKIDGTVHAMPSTYTATTTAVTFTWLANTSQKTGYVVAHLTGRWKE